MAGEKHELVLAALDGSVERVQAFIKKGVLTATSEKCQRSLVLASEMKSMNHLEVRRILLEWGVPPNAALINDGLTALHKAVEGNSVASIKQLMEAKADPTKQSTDGTTCLSYGLNRKPPSLDAVRELLRRGVKVGPNDEGPGLASCLRDVQTEKMQVELRKLAEIKVDHDAIEEADGGVWKAMREHMRLLREREEQKVGAHLVDLESRLLNEQNEAKACKEHEDILFLELEERRLTLQNTQSELATLVKEVNNLEAQEAEWISNVSQVTEELDSARSELRDARKEMKDAEEQQTSSEDDKSMYLKQAILLEEEIAEARKYNSNITSEIEEARQDLDSWMQDRDRAAALAMRAKLMLSEPGDIIARRDARLEAAEAEKAEKAAE